MRNFLHSYPLILFLIPCIGLIVCAEKWHFPHTVWDDSADAFLDSTRVFRVITQDYPHPCARSFRYEAEVLPTSSHVYLYLQADSVCELPSIGDTLAVYARFQKRQFLGSFDYGRYLRLNGIAATAYVPAAHWRKMTSSEILPWHLRPVRWQRVLHEQYRKHGITGNELGTLSALTLGYKEGLDPALRQQFQKAGAAHILAVSGLHTGILYSVLLFLLTGFGLFPPLYNAPIHRRVLSGTIVLCLTVYAAMTGFSPSVVRSVVMIALAEWCLVWHRSPFSMNLLLATACIILTFRPQDLYSVSFQLSFAAVAGILLLEPELVQLFPRRTTQRSFGHSIISYLIPLLSVSLAAWLYTLPISLYYFSQTSNLFFVTNLIVVPLAFCMMIGALGMWTIGWIPAVGDLIAIPLKWIAQGMNHSVAWVEQLPHGVSYGQLSLMPMLGMYLIIFTFTYFIKRALR